jgi:hypothetical protein
MARSGVDVTREQVFETALGPRRANPTVVSVRTRLGGGSPNTITPLLVVWKALHEHRQAATIPTAPEPVEAKAVMRQVWGAAWQEAQAQLEGERDALTAARKEIDKERAEMLAEFGLLDGELDAAREAAGQGGRRCHRHEPVLDEHSSSTLR